MTKNKNKLRFDIHNEQRKYKKLRNKAHDTLNVLEEYFDKTPDNEILKYQLILYHLKANQQEISYFGLRGILVGIIAAIFASLFNTELLPVFSNDMFLKDNSLFAFVINLLLSSISFLIFIGLFLAASVTFFMDDSKRRKQVYINQYLIEIVEERLRELNNK